MNKWLAVQAWQYNRQPQAALGGVSPEQAHALLYADWTTTGPIRLNESLTFEDVRHSRLLRNARAFLADVEEEGEVKATEAGNLNRKFVARMMEHLEFDEDYLSDVRLVNKVINEWDLHVLNVLRILLEVGGLLKKRSGRFSVTKNGRALLAEARAGDLYRHLFLTFFRKFNLGYIGLNEGSTLQAVVPIVLFRLSAAAREWTQVTHLESVTVHEAARPVDPRWPDAGVFAYDREIINPLVEFGLLESRGRDRLLNFDKIQVRTLPLYDHFLRFDF